MTYYESPDEYAKAHGLPWPDLAALDGFARSRGARDWSAFAEEYCHDGVQVVNSRGGRRGSGSGDI
jgi:hypothetical protein